MGNDPLVFDRLNLKGTDSNSLLRLYDQANRILGSSAVGHERAKADKAIRRIAKELQKRNVPL
jgi:hypothetical protein